MEWTNGVSEFRNTGNATTLLQIIPEEEQELKLALEKFDWATQGNAFDKIDKALQELMDIVSRPGKNKSKYADLRNMIYQVILSKYFQQNGVRVKTIQDIKKLSVAEKQFATCKWYLNQNRYGQALATGLEALRSMLVPLYLELKSIDVTQANCDNENHRKAAIQRLEKIKKYLEKTGGKQNNIQRLFGELEQCRMCAVPIRNVFAHNLKENVKCLCEQCSTSGSLSDDYCSKKITQTFISKLEQLYGYMCHNHEQVKKVYQKDYTESKKGTASEKMSNARIIISEQKLESYVYDGFKKSVKKTYDVYRLDDKILNALKNKKSTVSAAFYMNYFKEMCSETKNLCFILEGLNITKILHYAPALRFIGGNPMMKDGKVIGNLEYEIDWEAVERTDLGDDLETLLNTKLVKC